MDFPRSACVAQELKQSMYLDRESEVDEFSPCNLTLAEAPGFGLPHHCGLPQPLPQGPRRDIAVQ